MVSRLERLWQQGISSLSPAHPMMQTVNEMLTYASGHGFYVRPYDVVEEVVDEDIRNLTRILSESVSSGSSSSSSRVSPTTIPSYPESRDMGSDDERLRIIGSNNANQRPDMITINSLSSDSSSHSWSSSCHTVSPTTIPFNPEGRDTGIDDAEIDDGTFDERLRIIDSNYANQRPDLIPINSLTSNLSDSNLSLQHSNMSNH
jgi:hypothetical protein